MRKLFDRNVVGPPRHLAEELLDLGFQVAEFRVDLGERPRRRVDIEVDG